MPHTTTKIMRNKRADSRPNAKQRKLIGRVLEEAKTVQEIKVTRKRPLEKGTREVPVSKLSRPSEENALRAMKKKLKGIEKLLELQKSGISLDEQQTRKLDTLPAVLEKMEELMTEVDQKGAKAKEKGLLKAPKTKRATKMGSGRAIAAADEDEEEEEEEAGEEEEDDEEEEEE